ncbi:MAG: hypothetical protein M3Q44_07970 [bacterium]|nr:hypothetical protein [bacterium]
MNERPNPSSYALINLKNQLAETPLARRLKYVYLHCLPYWFDNRNVYPSRLEHSEGATNLVIQACRKEDFFNFGPELVTAMMWHDAGSPPGSHISDSLLEKYNGTTHEEFVRQQIADGLDTKTLTILKKYGIHIDLVLDYIEGIAPPVSGIISGDIDADNLNNVNLFGEGLYSIHPSWRFDPDEIAMAYCIRGGKLCLYDHVKPLVRKWYQMRRRQYEYIETPIHMAPELMLARVIRRGFETGELDRTFFLRTDHSAYEALIELKNPTSRRLLQNLKDYKHYRCVLDLRIEIDQQSPPDSITSSDLARELKIDEEQVLVHKARSKTYRRINTLFVNDNTGAFSEFKSPGKPHSRYQVYLAPECQIRRSTQATIRSVVFSTAD